MEAKGSCIVEVLPVRNGKDSERRNYGPQDPNLGREERPLVSRSSEDDVVIHRNCKRLFRDENHIAGYVKLASAK